MKSDIVGVDGFIKWVVLMSDKDKDKDIKINFLHIGDGGRFPSYVSLEKAMENMSTVTLMKYPENGKSECICPLCEMGHKPTPLLSVRDLKDNTDKLLFDYTPWHKDDIFAETKWEHESPEQIKENLDRVLSMMSEKIKLVVSSDMAQLPLLRKAIEESNKNNLLREIQLTEIDNVIENPEIILVLDTPPKMPKLEDIVFIKQETTKSRNFKDGPSIPSKKRRYKK